nr:hypothetical protein [Tanacetum cinerariifolium]
MYAEYNIIEKRRLKSIVYEKDSLLKSKCDEIESLKAQLIVKEKNELGVKVTDLAASVKGREQEVADLDVVVTSLKLQNDSLADQVHKLEVFAAELQEKVTVYEDYMSQLERFQDEKIEVNEKLDKLCADFVEMALHLKEKFYSHLLTTISGRRWLLTYGMEHTVVKCLNSIEHLSVLGAAISKAVEKGMQEGLSAGITHGAEDRKLADVAAYNPYAKADYLSALQRLQNVNFSLIAKLKFNKNASVNTIMNLLCLDDTLAERLGLTESQPRANQLMVPIHHSSKQRVIGASTLSFSLDVSHSRVRMIRENIASTISPISTDDYEVAHANGQEDADVGGETVADENVANIPCSRKGVSIAFSKPVCSLAQCLRDFVWSFPLRSELDPVFRMACFIALVDKVSWTKACASEPGVVSENGVSLLLDLIMTSVLPIYQTVGLGVFNRGEALTDT